jgi:hypothetical protein
VHCHQPNEQPADDAGERIFGDGGLRFPDKAVDAVGELFDVVYYDFPGALSMTEALSKAAPQGPGPP